MKLIRTATIFEQPVRFFDPCAGRPALPWHATNDLVVALGLRGLRPITERSTRVGNEIIPVASHAAALGMIMAAEKRGILSSGTRWTYVAAAHQAAIVLAPAAGFEEWFTDALLNEERAS